MDRFKLHGIYRHYKGNLYILEDVALHSETGEKLVLYRALYGDHTLWARPYDMFFSEINPIDHPEVKQKYRFELVEIKNQSA